ncbi:MAG: UDP-N-acetylglucosamine 1-carboxyvinyltransferase, partial [Gemmatimonadetes bacterium]|nr:UDP-N-acetylglucosamine 1-carboxyvinyltransferase [Gemmatimonadota bacterium]
MASAEVLFVQGGRKLEGEAVVQGSKNAALPMLAASLLATEGKTVLHRVPPVKDVLVAMEVLRRLGAKIDYDLSEEIAVIDTRDVTET